MRNKQSRYLVPICLLIFLAVGPVLAADELVVEAPDGFGGPNSVPNLIEADLSMGERWDDWKKSLQEEHGFGLGMDYTALYFQADDAQGLALPDGTQSDSAAAGNLRLYGTWDLVGRDSGNTGSLIWKFESRHNLGGSPSPATTWAALDLGYIGLIGPPFNDTGFRVQNMFWRQRFAEGRYAMTVGTIDPTDFLDLYGLVSPWLHFSNFAFATGGAAIDLPNDGGFGFGFGGMLTDNVYILANWQDANGVPDKPWESVGNFFNENEYFTAVEFGWTTGQGAIYTNNYHVTFWHKDRREEADKPSGKGVNFSFARFVDETWMPFLRGGWSDGGDSLLRSSLNAGIGYRLRGNQDLLGVGLHWGEPNENQGAGTDSQYAAEVFYRLKAGKRGQLTADLQYVKDPAASTQSSIWIVGLRGRLAF